MFGLQVIGIFLFSLLLIKGADWTVIAIRRLSRSFGISDFAIASIIVALGTSFPELFVGIAAGLNQTPNLSLGNIVGSNIANVAIIGGITAFVFGSIRGKGKLLRREIVTATLAGFAPLFLLLDGALSRVDALILLALYGLYASSLFKREYEQVAEVQEEESFWYRFTRRFKDAQEQILNKEMGRLFLGIAVLLFSADMIVRIGGNLAETLGIPVLLVGLFLVAIGTSLPELAFSFKAVEEHHPGMFFGNILGSTIANSTLVIGVTSLISPIQVVAFGQYVYAIIAFAIIYVLFWIFIEREHRLSRWQGMSLVLIYLVFIVVELLGVGLG